MAAPDGFTSTDRLGFWNAAHLVLLVVAAWLTWVGVAAGRDGVRRLLARDARRRPLGAVEGFPLVSLPRFLMDDFPIVLALAALTRERPRAREILLVAFGAVSAVAGVAFAHAVWIA